MKIEYDECYKCWVVLEKQGNGFFERFRGLKKDCRSFIKKNKRRREKNKNEKQRTNWI